MLPVQCEKILREFIILRLERITEALYQVQPEDFLCLRYLVGQASPNPWRLVVEVASPDVHDTPAIIVSLQALVHFPLVLVPSAHCETDCLVIQVVVRTVLI